MHATPTGRWPLPRPAFAAAMALMGGQGLAAALRLVEPQPLLAGLLAAAAVFVATPGRRRLASGAWVAAFALLGALGEARLHRDARSTRQWFEANQLHLARYAEVAGEVARVADRGAVTTVWLAPGSTMASAGAASTQDAPLPVRLPARLASRAPMPGAHAAFSGRARELEHSMRADSIDRHARSRGAVAGFDAVSVESRGDGGGGAKAAVHRAAGHLRERTLLAIHRAVPDGRGALLAAMMLGETEGLPRGVHSDFQRTGLVHLFSVSGLHTMLVGMLTLRLLGFLGLPAWLRAAAFALALLAFAGVAGFEAPVLRASMLLLFAVAGEFLDRPVDNLAGLSVAFLALAIPDPAALHTIEFQLTFLCALVLVLAQPWRIRLEETLGARIGWTRRGRVALALVEASAISGAIQVAAMPILASWFGQVSLVAPVANALLAVPAGLLIIAGFAATLLGSGFPVLGAALLGAVAWPVDWLAKGASWLAAPGFASLRGAHWPAPATALWLAAILASPWAVERVRARFAVRGTIAVAAILLPAALAVRSASWNAPVLRATFIDVGQGDSILLETRDGARALVDAGPGGDAARWLGLHGIDRLDWIAATHADFDHIGGMPEVLERVGARELLVNAPPSGSEGAAELAAAAASRAVPLRRVARGDRIVLGAGGVAIDVLHPTGEFLAAHPERNDGSLVLLVHVPGGGTLLLTGDAEESAEADMLAAGLIGHVDVLKAGHHGSGSSTTAAFVASARPRAAIMSCSTTNNFGHPDPGVLQRLAGASTAIWRTDLDGTVTVSFGDDGTFVIQGSRREGLVRFGE